MLAAPGALAAGRPSLLSGHRQRARSAHSVRCMQRGHADSEEQPTMRDKAAVLLSGLAATTMALHPAPAMAEANLYEKSKQLEAELKVALMQRGATLQELRQSPQLPMPDDLARPAPKPTSQVPSELAEQLRAQAEELRARAMEIRAKDQALAAKDGELRSVNEQLRERGKEVDSLRAAQAKAETERKKALAAAAEQRLADLQAEAERQKELRGRLEQQNKKIELLMRELETVKRELSGQKNRADGAEQVMTAVINAPPPEPNGINVMKNVAGILSAGGIAGFLLSKSRRDAVDAEIRDEKQAELERKFQEALAREKALLERTLAAEKQVMEAVRREAAAAEQASEVEEAEVTENRLWRRHLERTIEEVNSSLDTERALTQRLKGEASRTKAELMEALSSAGELRAENSELSEAVAAKTEQTKRLEATVASLTRQVEEATKQAAAQKLAFEKAVAMREAMMKEKQAQVDEAVRLRTEAEVLYKQAQQELRQERDRIQQLELELRAAQDTAAFGGQPGELSEELLESTPMVQALRGEIRSLHGKVAQKDEALRYERELSQQALAETMSLRLSLGVIKEELAAQQALVDDLKAAAASERADAENDYRYAELERQAREAMDRERELLERCLAAEQQLAEGSSFGGEGGEGGMSAEEAAENRLWRRHLERMLEEVNGILASERQLTQRLRGEASRTKAELMEALSERGRAEAEASSLAGSVEELRSRNQKLESSVAQLQRQVVDAERAAEQQRLALDKVMAQRESLAREKEAEVGEAMRLRLAAEQASAQAQEELLQEQERIRLLENKVEELKEIHQVVGSLRGEVKGLIGMVAETDKALRQEREISQQARAETANLRSELMAVQEAMMSNLIS